MSENDFPERKIITTQDGSKTVFIPEWNESYHSRHGSVREAYHVFIRNGLDLAEPREIISVLEIGFGTGLNALITLGEAVIGEIKIKYTGIEKFPVSEEIFNQLNYVDSVFEENTEAERKFWNKTYLDLMHAGWGRNNQISDLFNLKKIQADFLEFDYPREEFDVIYFDAFGPRVQPELWSAELFQKLYESLNPNGILTTYSSKGDVRRAMLSVGFDVKKVPGPPGKREMLIAGKLD